MTTAPGQLSARARKSASVGSDEPAADKARDDAFIGGRFQGNRESLYHFTSGGRLIK